ncbi:MAG TPA: Asp-tRNA(Asn)/Glu-tRNA(Gln) amidotransferase subunit GatB [Phnomibacter sp.]|nr:Asp-tRNA(Asn)/Glu-tRNA(Gln) amidotransferase subunit GatB [Phnomibacter sp.]
MLYQPVIGLEVHIQLRTRSKLFCSDNATYGAAPNTQVSPISLAHPGTLPVMNIQALDHAIELGLALGSSITRRGWFDRKHYFYPDLPKGYQTTQLNAPIIVGGSLAGVAIHHVHLEEDAGKSIHDADPTQSCIDLNRAGVPLLELVTDPVIHDAETASHFLTELRKLVRWLGICDGNMEEGSLRCDANISLRPMGESKLGTKVEVKNINSIRFVRKAIEAEIKRQTELLQKGEKVVQQTRGYDADKDTTHAQRDKEEAHDYRYFPCPDLPPFTVSDKKLEEIRTAMPTLPWQQEEAYLAKGLSAQDAGILAEDIATARYFNELTDFTPHTKAAANWMLGPVKKWLNEHHMEIAEFPLFPAGLAALVDLVASDKVNFSMAAARILPEAISRPEADPLQIANELNLLQEQDSDQLETWVQEVLEAMPDKVTEYKKGKKGLIGLFLGEVKKKSKGKADLQKATIILNRALNG